MTTATRSRLFSCYNVAKGMVADRGRLNRALGVAMRTRPRPVEYITTDETCSCPDFVYRQAPKGYGFYCKHIYARLLKRVAA